MMIIYVYTVHACQMPHTPFPTVNSPQARGGDEGLRQARTAGVHGRADWPARCALPLLAFLFYFLAYFLSSLLISLLPYFHPFLLTYFLSLFVNFVLPFLLSFFPFFLSSLPSLPSLRLRPGDSTGKLVVGAAALDRIWTGSHLINIKRLLANQPTHDGTVNAAY
jgi:hypothetical protein